ncbi:MAG: isocitrate/isopropylmalate dehydrogenase family protein [Planctomycetota bacterium]
MSNFNIAVLPGDGIGPEVTGQAVSVLQTACRLFDELHLEFTEHSVGASEYLKNGNPLPESAFEACEKSDAVLLGAMGLPDVRWPDGKEMTPQIDLRERLDLYFGIRPIYLYHANDSPLKKYQAGEIDFVIVRENTEGLFSARLSQTESEDEVRDIMRITRHASQRIIKGAFDLAGQRRKKVTLVDKANVLPSMVFFRSIFDEIAADYPDIETDRVYVDAASLFLVQCPHEFDVLVTENMFGDILSDLGAGLIGGLGMAPSGDIGKQCAVFQPSHGTAPTIAGRGIANPIATILSGAEMLRWLNTEFSNRAAQTIYAATKSVLLHPENRTPDMGGKLTTQQMGEKICQAMENLA